MSEVSDSVEHERRLGVLREGKQCHVNDAAYGSDCMRMPSEEHLDTATDMRLNSEDK